MIPGGCLSKARKYESDKCGLNKNTKEGWSTQGDKAGPCSRGHQCRPAASGYKMATNTCLARAEEPRHHKNVFLFHFVLSFLETRCVC